MKNYHDLLLNKIQYPVLLFRCRDSGNFPGYLSRISYRSILLTLIFLGSLPVSNCLARGLGKVSLPALTWNQDAGHFDFQAGERLRSDLLNMDCHECYETINLSLDTNCLRIITPDLVLKNPQNALDHPEYYDLQLTIGNGLVISDNTLRAQHVGKQITAMVSYIGPGPCPQGIACVSTITVKSEFEVTIFPNPAMTVYCSDPFLELDPSSSEYPHRPHAVQTCGGLIDGPYFGGDWVTIHDCVFGQDTAKTILRQWWAISKDGIRTIAMDTIYVLRLPPISASNFFCPENDTLVCGMSDTPVGPYMILPNLMSMSDCDTLYFFDPAFRNKSLESFCGLNIKLDSIEYENTGCTSLKRYIIQVHQNCYGTAPASMCELPDGLSQVQIEGGNGAPIYATCDFWLTNVDTVAPYVSCNLEVDVQADSCTAGYTLGYGYWRDHSIYGPENRDTTWDLLPSAEQTLFFLSGQTYYQVLQQVPLGNAYYILAYQYISARLNFLKGSDPSAVQDFFDEATELFLEFTPDQIGNLDISSKTRSRFIQLVQILDRYNNGRLGPGYCNADAYPTIILEAGADCTGMLRLEKILSIDMCHEVRLIKAMIDTVDFIILDYDSSSGYWTSDQSVSLPLREEPYQVILEAIDECYQVGRDTCEVIVVDATNPTAVAYNGLNVDLSTKVGHVLASQVNNNSTDNCGINLVLARRSDWFEHWVEFCDTAEFESLTNPDIDTTIWCRAPKAMNGEVEAIYAAALQTFATDGNACNLLLYQSWYYDLCRYATVDCQNALDEESFRQNYGILFPETNLELVSQIGGGWADRVPLTCSDVCDSVTVELLVMDFWCNWNKTWTKVFVEDKTPALVVSELTDSIEISCIAYNRDSTFNLTGVNDRVSMAQLFAAADTDNTEALTLLDSVLGGYEKAWINEMNQYVDINGTVIDPTLTFIDSGICECVDVIQPVQYYDLASQSFMIKDSLIQVCGTTKSEIEITKGIVAVNCSDNTQCTQEFVFDLDECGLGTITRRFKIWKSCGIGIPDTLVREQVITLRNHCELNKFMFDLPADTIVDGCAPQFDSNNNVIGFGNPDITGRPEFNFDGACRIVAVAHEDLVNTLLLPTGECYSILRTWYFADWCEIGVQNPNWWLNQNLVADSFTQVIILVDTIAPACTIDIAQTNDTVSLADCNAGLPATFYLFDTCGSFGYNYYLISISGAQPDTVAGGFRGFAGDVRDTMQTQIPDIVPGDYIFTVTATDACNNVGVCADTFYVSCDISRQAGMMYGTPVESPNKILTDRSSHGSDGFADNFGSLGRQDSGIEGFELYQNRPNPFRSETMIGFSLPESQYARLTIYDIQGRSLKVIEGQYGRGYHEVEISAGALGTTGVLYYQLETATYTSTRRMVITP